MKVYLRFFTSIGDIANISIEFPNEGTFEDLNNNLIQGELEYLRKALREDFINENSIEDIIGEYRDENGKMYWRIEGEI